MPITNYKPTTNARRNMSVTDYTGLSKVAPEKSLLASKKNHSGRNSYGRITVRHRGGGNRKKYRIIDFKRNKLVLRLVERNFSWPMVAKQMSERRGPLWARLMRDLEASPLAARYTEDELFKMIFVIIEMLGSVCYSSIIEGKPDTVDNMKPVLYGIVRKILS